MMENLGNGIYGFDPQIYPRRLWVAVGVSEEALLEVFDSVKPFDTESDDAQVEGVYDKIHGLGGYLIRFASLEDISFGTLSHEAAHAALQIFDFVNAKVDFDNQEPFTYLVGWISRCIGESVKKQKNLIMANLP